MKKKSKARKSAPKSKSRSKARAKPKTRTKSRVKKGPGLTLMPASSDPKPRKKRVTPISKSQWGPLERRLREMREDLEKTVQGKPSRQIVEADPGDEADQATQSIEKETQFEVSDIERTQLDQIEAALRRIEKGTYGTCESCRSPIDANRIQALPFVRYCINCQSTHESALVV